MPVRVVAVLASPVNSPTIGHAAAFPLPSDGQLFDEFPDQGDPVFFRKFDGQGKFELPKKTGVLPLVEVSGLPKYAGINDGPFREVAGLRKQDLPEAWGVFPRPHDVVVLGGRRLAGFPGAERGVQMVDSHAASFLPLWGPGGRVSGARP